jgi:hypothetical protein
MQGGFCSAIKGFPVDVLVFLQAHFALNPRFSGPCLGCIHKHKSGPFASMEIFEVRYFMEPEGFLKMRNSELEHGLLFPVSRSTGVQQQQHNLFLSPLFLAKSGEHACSRETHVCFLPELLWQIHDVFAAMTLWIIAYGLIAHCIVW